MDLQKKKRAGAIAQGLSHKNMGQQMEGVAYSLPFPTFLFLPITAGTIRFPPERTNKNDREEKGCTDQYEAEYEQERHLDLQKNCCGDAHADLLF